MSKEEKDPSAPENLEQGFFGIPPYAVRICIIMFVLGAIALAVRQMVVPASFGQYGYYRGDAIRENMAYPVVHKGTNSCKGKACHEERHSEWASEAHKTVNCENCHGAAGDHVKKEIDPRPKMKINDKPELCLLCHRSLLARPNDVIPQIKSLEAHMKSQELDIEDAEGKCITCHDPHSPEQ